MQLYDHQAKIIADTQTALRKGYKAPLIVLGCGGGKSVINAHIINMIAAKGKRSLILAHRIEIVKLLREACQSCNVDLSKAKIDMVQTISSMKNLEEFLKHFDIVIVDEAHHSGSCSYRRILQHFKYKIGFTATPYHTKGLADLYDIIISGPQTSWLQDNGFLAKGKLFAGSFVDYSNIKKTRGEYDAKQQSILLEHPDVYADCVRNYQKHADGLQTIVYNVSVAAAEGTAEAFRAAGYKGMSVDGKTPVRVREAAMRAFENGELQILTNALLYDEGLSVNGCSCTMLWKKTASLRLYIQATMRCLRADPKNPDKVGYVLDGLGNYKEHDLPWADREWTLETPPKGKKKDAPVKLCEQCECVCYASQRICPSCGYVFPQAEKLIPLIHLEALDDQILRKKRTWRDFKTWDEVEYARKRLKYKPAWSFYQCEENAIAIPENQKRRWEHIKAHAQSSQDAQNVI